uniref:Transient receptor potential cation channel, subfamily V, member 1 n=1 Tax=Scophthalmus maximus TaxID=52904 RepID=A0A8D3EB89_SCOMX
MKKSEMFGFSLETDNRTEEEKKQQQKAARVLLDLLTRKEQSDRKRESETFPIDRLFEAVASRDVRKLEGLHQYLHQNTKKLSDSLYQSYGKTALMKALLHLRDNKNETVELLIDISEKLGDVQEFVNAAYTSSYYKGQTALHIPHDGELPLSLAACTNQADVVDFLMANEHQRADAKLTDSQGNTVLHALVVVADNSEENTDMITSMYDRILKTSARLHPTLNLEDIENLKGLTPLKMAARTGKIGLFSHILKREFQDSDTKHLSRKFTEWVYGPVHSSLYDLSSVDSYRDGSVLEILIYSCDIPNRHEMLETEPLSQLLDEKWKKFAGQMFFLNFLFYILYLIIFTAVAYNKRGGKPPFPLERTTMGYLYVSGQLLTLLANIYFFFRGMIDMCRKCPNLKTLLIDGYYEILFLVQGALFLVSAGLYLFGQEEYLGVMVLCLALSWVNLLYFSRGDRNMGIYSVMIQKMILSDILRFLFVYIVFLFGFSAAVVTLLIEPPVRNDTQNAQKTRLFGSVNTGEECIKPTFTSISFTTLQLFKFTIGMGDMEFSQGYHKYKEVFYVLLLSYIILTYILLLNMLIALMNRTVERITMKSSSIWRLQRAVTILDMEKRLPSCLRRRFRCGVEKKLATALGEDRRWCFRVEEVNWNKWNINLGKINEDPGSCDCLQQPASDSPLHRPNRGRSWRGFFTDGSRRRQTNQSTEMNTPV